MTNGYRKAITDRIKESVNNWIETLKKEQPALLFTKQWQVQWPKGFSEGFNCLSVVTGSKKGKYLIAQVEFVLPRDLELDFDNIELVHKNEPFKKETKETKKKALPIPIDEPMMKQVYTAQEYAVRAVDTIDFRRRKMMRESI